MKDEFMIFLEVYAEHECVDVQTLLNVYSIHRKCVCGVDYEVVRNMRKYITPGVVSYVHSRRGFDNGRGIQPDYAYASYFYTLAEMKDYEFEKMMRRLSHKRSYNSNKLLEAIVNLTKIYLKPFCDKKYNEFSEYYRRYMDSE